MTFKFLIYLLVPLVLITACRLPQPVAGADDSVNFKVYTTFRICPDYPDVINEANAGIVNVENLIAVRVAVTEQLQKIGLTNNEENPQLEVGFEIITEAKQTEIVECKKENQYDYWPTCELVEYPYTEGTLIVYITDLSKRQVVWQSSVSGELENSAKIRKKVIEKIVKRIFEAYPTVNS